MLTYYDIVRRGTSEYIFRDTMHEIVIAPVMLLKKLCFCESDASKLSYKCILNQHEGFPMSDKSFCVLSFQVSIQNIDTAFI